MAKTFAKVAKTFARLLTTIIATRRRPILILHLEEKYAKMDCKNEIYTKNWVRSTWIAKSQLWQKVNGQSQCWSASWSTMTSADDVAVASANDVAMMTSLGLTSARGTGAWQRVGARDGAWSAWDLVQNFLAAREGAWQLRWWSGFHEQLDRRKMILVVPAKTQSEQGSRRWRFGSGFMTTNDGGCRSRTRDDD